MSAVESLHEGNLDQALEQLKQQVRQDPSNAKHRVFLFQLLVVLGDWERALNQLEVAGNLDAQALAMVQTYRQAIHCEALRREVFVGKRTPVLFGEPAQWMALLLESLKVGAEGRINEAQALRQQAFESAPATAGVVDGKAFSWIADADMRMGPMLEAIVNGRYYWIPFQQIKKIDIEKPEDLRDVVWLPAHFVWANGGEAFGLIPTRYPGSEESADAMVRLARKTEWSDMGGGLYIGSGQRVLATSEDERPLMDIREIVLQTT